MKQIHHLGTEGLQRHQVVVGSFYRQYRLEVLRRKHQVVVGEVWGHYLMGFGSLWREHYVVVDSLVAGIFRLDH